MTHIKYVLANAKSTLMEELKKLRNDPEFDKAAYKWAIDNSAWDEEDKDDWPGEVSAKLSNILVDLSKMLETNGDNLILWRCIESKDRKVYLESLKTGKYINDGKSYLGAGVCWSFRYAKNMPAPGARSNGREHLLILKAEVPLEGVDIWHTALLTMDSGDYDDEREIRLKKGAKLHIMDILDSNGDSLFGDDVSSLPAVAED